MAGPLWLAPLANQRATRCASVIFTLCRAAAKTAPLRGSGVAHMTAKRAFLLRSCAGVRPPFLRTGVRLSSSRPQPPDAFSSGGDGQQLAVPFSIDDKQARAAFTSWASSSSKELQSLRPEYLPMYFFRGCLRATYTGMIRAGPKSHERRTEGLKIEEQQVGIGFDHSTGDWRTARMTGVYAGFDYPPWYVEEALLTGGGKASGMPLSAAYAPPTTRVGAFAMNPAFAYDLVHARLGAVAEAAATTAFLAKSEVHRKAYEIRVEDMKHELHLPSLADGGVLLMPCFVCEYTFDGEPYTCFVSGINGQLIGMTHPRRATSFLYRTIGGSIGLLIGACGPLDLMFRGSTPVLAQAVVGAVVGTLIGHINGGRLEESVMAERFAKLNAERHQKWLAKLEREKRQESKKSEGPANEAFWQAEVDRVRAAVLPVGDARLVAGLASPPPGLEQDQMLRNVASLALSAKVRLQGFERYEQPPSTPAAQSAAHKPGSPSAGLTAVEFTDQEGDRSKLLVSGGKLQWHANGRVESRNVTALQLSEEGGVQTISAPSLPKINLGESQLREQIDEARERINERLPQQIASFLVLAFAVAFKVWAEEEAKKK